MNQSQTGASIYGHQVSPPYVGSQSKAHGTCRVFTSISPLALVLGIALLTVASSAQMVIRPSPTVMAGQEVLFDASAFLRIRPEWIKANFQWDFGDTYSISSPYGGVAASHVYMCPGDYTVTLTITDPNNNTITQYAKLSVQGDCQVPPILTGIDPILDLRFEGELTDCSNSNCQVRLVGTEPRYVQSRKGKGLDLAGGYVEVNTLGPALQFERLTISLWAKKANAPDLGCIVDLGNMRLSYPQVTYPGRTLELYIKTKNSVATVRNNWVTVGYDAQWHHYLVIYDGARIYLYLDATLMATAECTGGLDLGSVLTIGANLDGRNPINASVDEFTIWPDAIDLGTFTHPFRFLHADFHGHVSQYVYAQIPPAFRGKIGYKLHVYIKSQEDGSTTTLCHKDKLADEERVLLNNYQLNSGSYCLVGQLAQPDGKIVAELREYFSKQYDGPPSVGINKDNAICIDGKPFFPVTPWLLNDDQLPIWAGRFINALYGKAGWLSGGYGAVATIDSWRYYLDQGARFGLHAIGPAAWSGYSLRNSDLSKLLAYVDSTKNAPGLLMWMWDDEPDLGGASEVIIPQVLRAWTYASHLADPQHLVATNLAGSSWTRSEGWHVEHRRSYTCPYNIKYFGGKGKFVADVYGLDFYPIDWAAPSSMAAKVEHLTTALSNLRSETRNLVPFMSFVETCDIAEPPYPTPYPPSPEQLRMLIWLNVIHGAKGINWFHYFGATPTANFGVMQEFLKHITFLTPVVLAPEAERRIIDTSDQPGNRVDTTLREDPCNIWVFAARVTEVNETHTITTTFQIEGLASEMEITEPSEVTRSICEYLGDSRTARKSYTLRLRRAPIHPGSLLAQAKKGSLTIWAADNGNGTLKVLCPGYGNIGGSGSIDYQTGQLDINWGSTPGVGENLIGGSAESLGITYIPEGTDRIIQHEGGTFTDMFLPNDVHIYRIAKNPGNKSPRLQNLGPVTVRTADPVSFQVSAEDPDGDVISYSARNMPEGARFEGQFFSWTPQVGQAGTYQVTFVASDGKGGEDSQTITITVLPAEGANHAPVLETIGNKAVVKGTLLSFVLSATDADGDQVSYSASGLPTGASLSGNTFSWTPAFDQVGTYQVTFTASDGKGGEDSETITITVQDINRAPHIDPIQDKAVEAGSLVSFSVTATDPDGDSLTIMVSNLPQGATFAGNTFTWTPAEAQVGSYNVTFTASDGRLQDSKTVRITVASADKVPPVVYDQRPGPNAIQVPLDPLIGLRVADAGLGVDGNSIQVLINGQTVYAGNTAEYASDLGTCRRTGDGSEYTIVFEPSNRFCFDQTVLVTVTAKDLAGNVMDPCMYSFSTQMRLFGRNLKVSTAPADLAKARPATAADRLGNLWFAWQAGPEGSRDVYVARFDRQSRQMGQPVQLTADPADQCNPAIAVSDGNCVYVVWQDNSRGNWDLCARYSQDGLTWSGLARLTDSNDNELNPAIAIDHRMPHRVYVAWQDNRRGNYDIFVSFTDNAFIGQTYWQVTNNAAEQTDPAIAITPGNTVYVAWTDKRNVNADIYCASSANSFGTNVPLVSGPGNQTDVAIASEPAGAAVHLVWVDDRSGNKDIFYASCTGLPQAPLQGARITDDTSGADQSSPDIRTALTPQGGLGVFACWQDARSIAASKDTDIYFADLGPLCTRTNVLVGDDKTSSNQSQPVMGIDINGQPYLAWTDDRDGTTGIYMAMTVYSRPEPIAQGVVRPETGGIVGPASPTAEQEVSVQVPPGAVSAQTQITVSPIEAPPSTAIEPVAGYDLGPSGAEFSQPVTVTIAHQAGTNIAPCWYNPATDSMSQEGITDVNTTTLPSGMKGTSFKTTHFTQFYIFDLGQEEGTDPIERISGGGGGCCLVKDGPDQAWGFLLPFTVLAMIMAVVGLRDRARSGR